MFVLYLFIFCYVTAVYLNYNVTFSYKTLEWTYFLLKLKQFNAT